MSNLSATALTGETQVSDYIALLKPRVMSLVVFTGFAGMSDMLLMSIQSTL